MVFLDERTECALKSPTFVGVLAGELCYGISHLCPYRGVGFVGQALEQLGAYGLSLSGIEGEEQVGGLA